MKNIIVTYFCLLLVVPAISNNKDYCNQLRKMFGIELSFPNNIINIKTDKQNIIFTFGEILKELPTLPIFECGAVFKLSNDCFISLPDIESPQQIKTTHLQNYKTPAITGWMLNNCETPWAQWYIENKGGVISTETPNIAENDLTLLKEKVSSLRMQHEKIIENNELTKKTNCERICIVRIPNIEKIKTHNPSSLKPCLEFGSEIKSNITECYGIELYKNAANIPLKMLLFINGNNTTFEDCIANITDYFRFE